MRFRKVAGLAMTIACLFGMTASVTATAQAGGVSTSMQASANAADAEFVRMMIPHHFQALVMSRMAPTRSSDEELLALASRIDVEQDLEIYMMQSWQQWNNLPVTDAEQAYQQMLQNPMMLEMMGMATPEELDDLSSSTGTAFDVLYLELMIEHHEGALDMLIDVLTNGSDETLMWWATDMLTVQQTQIMQMEEMLADMQG